MYHVFAVDIYYIRIYESFSFNCITIYSKMNRVEGEPGKKLFPFCPFCPFFPFCAIINITKMCLYYICQISTTACIACVSSTCMCVRCDAFFHVHSRTNPCVSLCRRASVHFAHFSFAIRFCFLFLTHSSLNTFLRAFSGERRAV